MDVIFCDSGDGLRGHPTLVFEFGPDGRTRISIEARITKGQQYAVFRSLYQQQELIFVAAAEPEIVLRRTKYSERQWGYLYHLNSEDAFNRSGRLSLSLDPWTIRIGGNCDARATRGVVTVVFADLELVGVTLIVDLFAQR